MREITTHAESITDFPRLQTIKYAGNKQRLLDFIVPKISQLLPKGSTFVDLMAGTHAVGYALKQRCRIVANDIQYYSFVIGKAIIENNGVLISRRQAENDVLRWIDSRRRGRYDFFEKNYANTYFTLPQCKEIDSIRFGIEQTTGYRLHLYLLALMSAMGKVANTAGHYAEYLSQKSFRGHNDKSILEVFLEKCDDLNVQFGLHSNVVTSWDYTKFLDGTDSALTEIISHADLIYIDPPYSGAHYSRYYHILETVALYDFPILKFKGLYRDQRYQSPFSIKSRVTSEFHNIFARCSEITQAPLALSYVDSNRGLLTHREIESIARRYYRRIQGPFYAPTNHSKLGNGTPNSVMEYLLIISN